MNLFHEAKKVLDKDGKVNALGPYGKMKLTGMEVNAYFKKNKVKDPEVKKAVEVALDLSGADTIARKEIAKFYGSAMLKKKEVQNALKYANEQVMKESKNQEKLVDLFNKLMDVKYNGPEFKKIKKEIDKLQKEELGEDYLSEKIVGTGDAISKIFKTKNKKEIDGIANLMNMTSLKVLQSMQKQNPKGFSRMAAKMGELPAMEEIQEAKDLDPATVGQIAALTDRNDHNKAVLVLAKTLKEMKVVKMMEHIIAMHKINGSMSSDMINIRKEMLNLLMKKSKKTYSNHKEIYGAF